MTEPRYYQKNYHLTPRETEVLRCGARGLSTRETADVLGVKPNTVYSHWKNILQKTGVSRRAAAVAIGFQEGWIPLNVKEIPKTGYSGRGMRSCQPSVILKGVKRRVGSPSSAGEDLEASPNDASSRDASQGAAGESPKSGNARAAPHQRRA